MDWRDSEASEDDAGHHDDSQASSRKRSSRACDQCRKTKSKCERTPGNGIQCKSCALAGTACTFLGPSYKRGPPKGYIHAIEQRWHQVESLLGAILQCPDPRVKDIVAEMRQDDLAREILGRVDMGPYGPSGRRNQPADATKEDFFASILKSNESGAGRDSSRSRRQSRVSREIVSSTQDHGLSVVPTKEWQDNLSQRLSSQKSLSSMQYRLHAGLRSSGESAVPASQKRRLNKDLESGPGVPDWNTMYTMDAGTDEYHDAAESLGQLSLDEHQEVRFHGQASGLHLLGRSLRTDDRIEGGIWRLPMARVWPPSKYSVGSPPVDDSQVQLPPLDVQDNLISLYFTYIHPVFPVIHKSRFLAEYQARKYSDSRNHQESFQDSPHSGSAFSSPRPEPSQELTPLLLLSIFAISARFVDATPLPSEGKMWEAGCGYLDNARQLLTRVFHRSRPSTVQSLLLLGYREFGIGSMEQGWIFIGMAIRMAFDLGLNCDSSRWKKHGHDLFSPAETQTRRQIWWACCLADRYGSVYMGRPIMIKDGDFDTPLPDIDPTEDCQPWQPVYPIKGRTESPMQSRVMSTFCAVAKLAVVMGAIVTHVYPVRPVPGVSRQTQLADLEARLDQWYITLPEPLRYDTGSRRLVPAPQILFLHMRYWGAVLLLHRAFIPNWKRVDDMTRNSNVGSRAFDLAQAAASHIGAIVTVYRETFTLRRTSPFLTSYLLSASIMHIVTCEAHDLVVEIDLPASPLVTVRPTSIEASLGLQQCMAALKEMEYVWPSASRAWDLLNGVKLGPSNSTQFQSLSSDRNKRHAEDAFGQEKNPGYLQREYYETPQSGFENQNGVQELSTRLMAHMLGLEVPGVEPSTSYYPGYEWWPRPNQDLSQPSSQPLSPSGSNVSNMVNLPTSGMAPQGNNWVPNASPDSVPLNYSYDFSQFGV